MHEYFSKSYNLDNKMKKKKCFFMSIVHWDILKGIEKKIFIHLAMQPIRPWRFFFVSLALFWKSMNTVVDIEPKNKISFR